MILLSVDFMNCSGNWGGFSFLFLWFIVHVRWQVREYCVDGWVWAGVNGLIHVLADTGQIQAGETLGDLHTGCVSKKQKKTKKNRE